MIYDAGEEARIKTVMRLDGMDALEKAQPFGVKSLQRLSAHVSEKEVDLHARNTDRYDRTIGTLKIGTRNINVVSVRNGWRGGTARFRRGGSISPLPRRTRMRSGSAPRPKYSDCAMR